MSPAHAILGWLQQEPMKGQGIAMTKIHLDTDIGGDMDDLCALAMLLK